MDNFNLTVVVILGWFLTSFEQEVAADELGIVIVGIDQALVQTTMMFNVISLHSYISYSSKISSKIL